MAKINVVTSEKVFVGMELVKRSYDNGKAKSTGLTKMGRRTSHAGHSAVRVVKL